MRVIQPGEELVGERVILRLVTLDDVTDTYVSWLEDPEVNKYLETRWSPQTKESVAAFVRSMIDSPDSYLFAIVPRDTRRHVGNIKLGPIRAHHDHADVSYFIGDRACWGKGLATDAIRVVTTFAFERAGLHRVQAGMYESNVGSSRALEKLGFRLEARLRKHLRSHLGWEDHLYYGMLRDEWLDAQRPHA